MKLLREFQDFNYDRALLEQSKKEGRFLMRGILQKGGIINANGRIYSTNLLHRELENYQKLIKENRSVGCLDHPDESVISLKSVSHIIREAHMEPDGTMVGVVKILNSRMGQIGKHL